MILHDLKLAVVQLFTLAMVMAVGAASIGACLYMIAGDHASAYLLAAAALAGLIPAGASLQYAINLEW
jgi:hypothetical protein